MTLLNGSDNNDKLVVIGFNSDGSGKGSGFAVYANLQQQLINQARDTIIESDKFKPMMKVYIKGRTQLGPVSYAPNKGLFAVTSGKEVLFFKNPAALFSGTTDKTDVEPDYVVSGANTGLVEPWGVTIDDRRDEGKFFYVSDLTNHTISRFPLLKEGNIQPDIAAKTYGTLRPNYIFLDGRSITNF